MQREHMCAQSPSNNLNIQSQSYKYAQLLMASRGESFYIWVGFFFIKNAAKHEGSSGF